MRPDANSAVQWLAEQEASMTALLQDLVNIDSPSQDKAGVVNVFKRLERFFGTHGTKVEWHEHEGIRNAMSVTVPGRNTKLEPILLLGHCDTVFPTGEAKRRPFSITDGRAYGPGVADMKAGVAMNAFIIAGVQQAGGMEHPVIALFTNDEEIGSPTSKFIIERFAKKAGSVFNAEPGRPGGQVVTKRKGGVFFDMSIQGKAAHSGANFSDGISATLELANKIIALDQLTDIDSGVTVNVGLVSGGQSVNTVAPNASCSIDLRIHTLEDRDRVLKQIEKIAQTSTVEGTQTILKITGEFRPFVPSEGSEALYALYQDAAQQIGLTIGHEHSGGCADSGITSSLGCATLCATGPVGGNPHTPDEYVELNTLIPRAQAIMLSIEKLGELATTQSTTPQTNEGN